MACDLDRSTVKLQQTKLALEHAWFVATQRCPTACPPREIEEPVAWENHREDGVCRDDQAYFLSRIFFECAEPERVR
jgi:hypothetical protein